MAKRIAVISHRKSRSPFKVVVLLYELHERRAGVLGGEELEKVEDIVVRERDTALKFEW